MDIYDMNGTLIDPKNDADFGLSDFQIDAFIDLARKNVSDHFGLPLENVTGLGITCQTTVKIAREAFMTFCNHYNEMVKQRRPVGLQSWMIATYDGPDSNGQWLDQ